jgi:hypothetical protein
LPPVQYEQKRGCPKTGGSPYGLQTFLPFGGSSELTRSSPEQLCLIPVLFKALDILELLQKEKKPLPVEAIYQRTSISKTVLSWGRATNRYNPSCDCARYPR